MSYVALYREWRPKTFREIIGQEHITRTLKNQIEQGRVAHAYLLCGTRGTGKTTTAKVLAKAVNCMHSKDNEPCGKCEICTGIDNGNIMDVIEIDAASNNGVDNIRELRDDVKYLPSKCRYKVYIIDEVHMLSTAAFNALLKTLEEPPAHIVFILATTEFQKVPATILSRCQRFDFKRIKTGDIVKRLKDIADEDKLDVDERALGMIARNSDGALRDALSIFDQCISLSDGTIKYEDVTSILGITTDEYLLKITDAIAAKNFRECISLIDELVINGKDVHQFMKDVILHFRNLMISSMGDSASDILNVSDEMLQELKAQSKKFSTEAVLKNINILSAAEVDAKRVPQPRIILEMAVLKACKEELCTDVDSLLERIANLERTLAGKVVLARNTETNTMAAEAQCQASEEEVKRKPDPVKHKKPQPVQDIQSVDISKKWKDILKAISDGGHKRLYAFMLEGKVVGISEGVLILGFEKNYKFHKERVEEAENTRLAEEYIASACGTRLKLKCVIRDEIAVDIQEREEDIVEKAISVFGEELVEVEE